MAQPDHKQRPQFSQPVRQITLMLIVLALTAVGGFLALPSVLITFLKDNIASIWDLLWLKNAGGMFGGKQVPSHRFNPAEKGMYWWGMFFPGLLAVVSGLVLDKLIPGLGITRGEMQIAHMIHLVATVIMMSMVFGHIYMGTLGVRGK